MYSFEHFITQNPWRIDEQALNLTYFPRKIETDIRPYLLTDEPLLITGPREAGKTALLHFLIRTLIKDEHKDPGTIFYFNLDDPLTTDFFRDITQVQNFLRCFRPHDAARLFLIIDEAQYLSKSVSEQLSQEINLKLIWTASRRWPYSWHGHVFLMGSCNYRDFLGPVLKRRNYYLPVLKEQADPLTPASSFSPILMPHLEEYMLYGGFPRVVRLMTPASQQKTLREIIGNQFKAIAQSAIKVSEPDKFVRLLTLLAAQNGQSLNLLTLKRQAGLDYRTIKRYLGIMQDHYLITLSYPDQPGQTSASGIPLVYFNDLGARNILLNSFNGLNLRADRKELLENFLFRELQGLAEINSLSFIRTRHKTAVFSFQAKDKDYLAAVRYDYPQNKQGMKGLVNLAQRLKPQRMIIFTRDFISAQTSGTTELLFLPAYWAWALPEIIQKG